MMPRKLVAFNNILVELPASLFTVCAVKPGSYVSEGIIEKECNIKEIKFFIAIKIE
jgi:hypothetical protein